MAGSLPVHSNKDSSLPKHRQRWLSNSRPLFFAQEAVLEFVLGTGSAIISGYS